MKKRILVVYSDYYKGTSLEMITVFKDKCLEFNPDCVFTEVSCFGVSEIPFSLNYLLKKNNYDAVVVFGVVIQGETYHHELINNYVYKFVYDCSIENEVPLGYGILNLKSESQLNGRVSSRAIEVFKAILNYL